MSEPIAINLVGIAGSDLVVDLAVFKLVNTVQVPIDLTGATMWMTVKVRYADPDPGVVQVTSSGSTSQGGIVINSPPTAGLATATITNTVFASVPTGADYVYDVKVRESSGLESAPIRGRLTIKPAVTRAS